MTISTGSLLFADANVFIEGLFIQDSAASVLINIIFTGAFSIATCKRVIHDVENVILKKLSDDPDRFTFAQLQKRFDTSKKEK